MLHGDFILDNSDIFRMLSLAKGHIWGHTRIRTTPDESAQEFI